MTTTLTASQARIPAGAFSRLIYQNEAIQITRRGETAYLIPERDWKLLQAVKAKAVDRAGDDVIEQFDELLHRLAK